MMHIAKAGAKPRRGAGEMFPVIEKYLASELTQKTFCQQENLNYQTFHYWLKKYRKQQKTFSKKRAHAGQTTAFLPVHISQPATAESPVCEITYPSGINIRFNQPVAVSVLRQLVELESA